MSNSDDFILVLCYANWCGHCKNFYLKKEVKDPNDKNKVTLVPLTLDEVKNNKDLSWQKVKDECNIKATQFEESELHKDNNTNKKEEQKDIYKEEKNKDGINIEDFNLKDLASRVKGWPTILILKKDNSGKYIYHDTYDGSRGNIEEFKNFIKKSMEKQNGGKKSTKKGTRKGTRKGSRKGSRKIQDGGKRRTKKSSKKSSRKSLRKSSRKIQEGGKRRTKKSSKKSGSKKGKKN